MAKNWEQGICNEKSGFLFNHDCLRGSAVNCNSCQKPICDEHAHEADGLTCCTSCAKKIRGKAEQRSGSSRSGTRHGRSHYHDSYHAPYFYGGDYYGYGYHDSYYGRSHHDPSDFTEADSESLAVDSDEDFENDMSES